MARILIAEDEPRIASFVEKGLRANGFTTIVVEDGITAATVARDEDFDIMVLGLGLPGRDGLDVIDEIRSRARRCRWSSSPPATEPRTPWPASNAGPTTT